MRLITHIILHCSDSLWGDAKIIDQWHRDRGFGCIGYHYVILNGYRTYCAMKESMRRTSDDGLLESGRPIDAVGAHCLGYNENSIGICLIGSKGSFTVAQMQTARKVVYALQEQYLIPTENILGHCETRLSHGKTCPDFDVALFRASLVS